MSTPSALLVSALRAVAANCDGAATTDGVGFNGTDSHFGKSLAQIDPSAWSPEVTRQAWEVLRKYSGQISAAGIDFDQIPEPEGKASREIRVVDVEDGLYVLRFRYDPNLIASVKSIPGARWRPATKTWSAPLSSRDFLLEWIAREDFAMTAAAITVDPTTPIESALTVAGSVSIVDGRLAIAFEYDPILVAEVKSIVGRRWDMTNRIWSAPLTSIREVRSFALAHSLTIAPEIEAVPDVETTRAPILGVVGGQFSLSFPYDRDLIEQVRDLPGARWSGRSQSWLVDTEAAVEVALLIEQTQGVVTASAMPEIEAVRGVLEMIDLSSAHDADLEIPGLGGTLMPFQRAGIAYALRTRRTFIGDEPGLGKTVQALGTLKATDAFPALIVCPATLRENWLRETRKWLPGKSIEVLHGTAGAPRMTWSDVTIVNYDVLHGWTDAFTDLRALVLDESHYAKSAVARRSKAATKIADLVAAADGVILNLTGTPVLNAATEIMSQLRILNRLEEFGGARGFRERYGHGKNLTELNRRLRATCFIRRRKIDVLPELPPKRWSDVFIEGDPKIMLEYREAEGNLIYYLSEKARRLALESGASDKEAQTRAWIAGMRASAAEHLVAVTALKRLAARAKMPAATSWIEDFLETGKKLVAFGWHRDVVDEIADRFAAGTKIQGGQSPEDRQDAVDRFQESEDLKVISCSIRAAGVGLTLTAASDVAFFELGWNPADMDQAADRCHRIGQADSVTAWQMIAAGTIDEDIVALIQEKRAEVNAVTDGSTDTVEDTSVLADLIVRLTQRGLASGT